MNLNLLILIYILLIIGVYFVFIFLPEIFFGFGLTFSAKTYILLSASAIILTTWGEKISILIRKLFYKNYLYNYELRALDQKKIRFLLMFIYFIGIIVFTLASLTSHTIFDIDKMDYSIIQSFATYISYDRLVRNFPTVTNK